MKIVFLLSFIPNPRMKRRIELLKQSNNITLIYWNRTSESEKENLFSLGIKIIEIKLKADFHLNNPLTRILRTIKFLKKALKSIKKEKPNILYIQNIDMLYIAYKYLKSHHIKIIYEIADINTLILDKQKSLIKKIISYILKKKEKKYCKKVSLLIITSPKYYDVYYKNLIDKSKVFFIPNIPNLSYFKNYKRKNSGQFTVAYIGVIRYEEQIKMLIDVAKEENVKVLIAGNSYNDIIKKYIENKQHCIYHGPYRYEKEIAFLYSQADCIYSVYDTNKKNVQIALPNRLYEAIYLHLPLIVSKNTYLEEIVAKLSIGIAISNKKELAMALRKLKANPKIFEKNFIKSKYMLNSKYYQNMLLEALEKLC